MGKWHWLELGLSRNPRLHIVNRCVYTVHWTPHGAQRIPSGFQTDNNQQTWRSTTFWHHIYDTIHSNRESFGTNVSSGPVVSHPDTRCLSNFGQVVGTNKHMVMFGKRSVMFAFTCDASFGILVVRRVCVCEWDPSLNPNLQPSWDESLCKLWVPSASGLNMKGRQKVDI